MGAIYCSISCSWRGRAFVFALNTRCPTRIDQLPERLAHGLRRIRQRWTTGPKLLAGGRGSFYFSKRYGNGNMHRAGALLLFEGNGRRSRATALLLGVSNSFFGVLKARLRRSETAWQRGGEEKTAETRNGVAHGGRAGTRADGSSRHSKACCVIRSGSGFLNSRSSFFKEKIQEHRLCSSRSNTLGLGQSWLVVCVIYKVEHIICLRNPKRLLTKFLLKILIFFAQTSSFHSP